MYAAQINDFVSYQEKQPTQSPITKPKLTMQSKQGRGEGGKAVFIPFFCTSYAISVKEQIQFSAECNSFLHRKAGPQVVRAP